MGLFERLKSVVSSKEWPATAAWVPTSRVSPAPVPVPPPFSADATYLRLWATEVHLTHSRKWFTEWHPAVHAAVLRRYGDQSDETVSVIGPAGIPGTEQDVTARVTKEKELTPLLPFPGGTLSMNVGLVAVKGDNTVRKLVDVVGSLGGIITSTALGTGTAVASAMVDGFESLLGITGDVGALAYDGTLAAEGGGAPEILAPGYLAIVDRNVDEKKLWVVNGRLVASEDGVDATSIDASYLLLRLESRTKRDEWRYLRSIAEPLTAARRAFDAESRRSFYQQAIAAARTSPDLHEADRIIIADTLRAQRDSDGGLGAVEGLADDLAALAAAATLTAEDALRSRPSLSSLLV